MPQRRLTAVPSNVHQISGPVAPPPWRARRSALHQRDGLQHLRPWAENESSTRMSKPRWRNKDRTAQPPSSSLPFPQHHLCLQQPRDTTRGLREVTITPTVAICSTASCILSWGRAPLRFSSTALCQDFSYAVGPSSTFVPSDPCPSVATEVSVRVPVYPLNISTLLLGRTNAPLRRNSNPFFRKFPC